MKNDCGHECFIIGGSFIAEDPDCPIHGLAGRAITDEIESLKEEIEALLVHMEKIKEAGDALNAEVDTLRWRAYGDAKMSGPTHSEARARSAQEHWRAVRNFEN